MIENQGRDPHLWDAGCLDDDVRNRVILPDLVSRIERLRPDRIADVGSGTGYISRTAAGRLLSTTHKWTLLEKDYQMRLFAEQKLQNNDAFEVIDFDVFDYNSCLQGMFDLVFSSFSTLDFGMDPCVAKNLVNLVRRQGSLLIYVPDMLEEIGQMCAQEKSLEPLFAYRRGEAGIRKPDRFTQKFEPFIAHRIELCISQILDAGARLSQLNFLKRDASRSIVALEFLRCNETI